jgi:hypothetical protein
MKKREYKKDLEFLELDEPEDELKYMLWQAEFNNKLISFWKHISR